MKSLDELRQLREEAKKKMMIRQLDDIDYRVVVGMATCGIAAGARPVLNCFVNYVNQYHLPIKVSQTGCIGMCTLEPIVEIYDKQGKKTTYVLVNEEKAKEIIEKHLIHGECVREYTIGNYKR